MSEPQQQALNFLRDPRSYSHAPEAIEVIQTHAAYVFLAPPFVYKIKKPVDFGFLDYSTLEKRRRVCEREIQLNCRLAPNVYLEVVSIYRAGNRVTFDAHGEVIEYAVKMRQLNDAYFMTELLSRGELGRTEIDRVVAALKDFYRHQPYTPEIAQWGEVKHLKISTDENFRQIKPYVDQTLSRPAFEAIRYYTNEFFRRHPELFQKRIREGRIKDCHGDLHLEHVHLGPEEVAIYDCIEFNDRFRHIDVANDVAFLAMDLDEHGRPDLARYLVEQIASATGDQDMPRVMDFYKCYRAVIRGKVASLQLDEKEIPEAERERSRETAARYFKLALSYALAGSEPLVLCVMGPIASGKSTLATALSRETGWEIVASDRTRKELARLPLHERTPARARSRIYSSEFTKKTYDRLLETAVQRCENDASTIIDATFGRKNQREKFVREFERLGIQFCVIEAIAVPEIIRRRLRKRESESAEISDARLEDFDNLYRNYEPPKELPENKLISLNTDARGRDPVTGLFQKLIDLRIKNSGARGK